MGSPIQDPSRYIKYICIDNQYLSPSPTLPKNI